MTVSVPVVIVSSLLAAEARLAVWAVLVAAWIVLLVFIGRSRVGLGRGMRPADSLVERFGTFTIVVLGEVVFGVVNELSLARHDFETISTGMIALAVGFGFWWIYFDVVEGRLPKGDGRALTQWILGHLPIALSIAAAGAGMVSLLEHAHDAATPAPIAWLLSGAVAFGLIAVIPTLRALADAGWLAAAYRPLPIAMAGGAVSSAVIGVTRPAPWLLALLLVVVLALVWAVASRGFLLAGAWGTEQTGPSAPR